MVDLERSIYDYIHNLLFSKEKIMNTLNRRKFLSSSALLATSSLITVSIRIFYGFCHRNRLHYMKKPYISVRFRVLPSVQIAEMIFQTRSNTYSNLQLKIQEILSFLFLP